jgi:hypothetical protein
MPIAPDEEGDCDIPRLCVGKKRRKSVPTGTEPLNEGESLKCQLAKAVSDSKQRTKGKSKNKCRMIGHLTSHRPFLVH